jgi:hypothetical protein
MEEEESLEKVKVNANDEAEESRWVQMGVEKEMDVFHLAVEEVEIYVGMIISSMSRNSE